MGNIVEKKIEEYPRHIIEDSNPYNRGYNAGYDQAMQDFLEKACDYLQKNLWRVTIEDGEFRQRFVTDFKNYMQDEM